MNIIRREIQRLCSFLAENSVNIIDAIQVNDKIVGSTLGKYDG